VEPTLSCHYLEEPKLQFADGREHVDPKIGILRYGPKTQSDGSRHPASVRVGFIGTASSVESAQKWLEESSRGYAGDEKHPEFPGFMGDRGFFSSLSYDSQWISQITQSEVADLQNPRLKRDRFDNLLSLIDGKLNTLSGKDFRRNMSSSAFRRNCTSSGGLLSSKTKRLELFIATSIALSKRLPCATEFRRKFSASGRRSGKMLTTIRKLRGTSITGLYFKAGGFPWGPLGLTPDSCYLGVSFFRPLGSKSRTVQSALIQAFDHHGQGLVLRGPDFEWDQDKEGTPAPHLSTELAHQLVDLALEQYGREMDRPPQRVVIHKTSRFWDAEKEGFESAIKKRVRRYDLVALSYQNAIRLMPQSNYPPLRGTRFSIGDLDFLYTTGFISELGQFHSLHVPSPLQIADHIGSDTSREQILREVLILTKLNWNSARLGGSLPITLRFSRLVGNILKELPEGTQPLTNYKFYM